MSAARFAVMPGERFAEGGDPVVTFKGRTRPDPHAAPPLPVVTTSLKVAATE